MINVRKLVLVFLVVWSGFCSAGPILPKLTIILHNHTLNQWALNAPPKALGCKIVSDISSYRFIAPKTGSVTISATCSDSHYISLLANYVSGDSNFSVGYIHQENSAGGYSKPTLKISYRTNLSLATDTRDGYVVWDIFPENKQLIKLTLVGHFDPVAVPTYAQQIVKNFSPAAMSVFDTTVDDTPFKYELSPDNTKLILNFTYTRLVT